MLFYFSILWSNRRFTVTVGLRKSKEERKQDNEKGAVFTAKHQTRIFTIHFSQHSQLPFKGSFYFDKKREKKIAAYE